jgi:hypothetical protein
VTGALARALSVQWEKWWNKRRATETILASDVFQEFF